MATISESYSISSQKYAQNGVDEKSEPVILTKISRRLEKFTVEEAKVGLSF